MTIAAAALTLQQVLELVGQELQEAQTKFPPFNSAHEGYAVILEELDELWTVVKANHRRSAIDEAVQVAAMAVRFVLDIDRPITNGEPT